MEIVNTSAEGASLAFLDAKSAFDVVSHESLMRKLFKIGVEGNMWTFINSLHKDAKSAVKWQGEISVQFRVEQGVCQCGTLSTVLYKVYNDGLLDILMIAENATRIGPIICVAPACADDCAVGADGPGFYSHCLTLELIIVKWKDTCTVLVKIKTHISCFMEKLPECKIKNFMEKKKITWRNAGEK